MKTIAVTGSTGFVGKRLMAYNIEKFHLRPINLRDTPVNAINLLDVDVVLHLAGKAHQMEPIDDKVYFDVNYELTKQLADKALLQGIKQFIYISSTKVYGDDINEILSEHSPCLPVDAYGASKLKAEQYLQSLQSDSFKIAIIRPPLVYGPGVKGNMIRLLQLADKNFPLPFGKINNARSMVFIDNLIELINTIVFKETAGVFIAGDVLPVSTEKLLLLMRTYLDNNKGLVTVPGFLRNIIKKLRPLLYMRLFGSFVVDNSSTNRQLDFTPPYSTAYGVEQMVKWFKPGLPLK
ncbi:MAG: NAD-dependent epimerase/dehydratase family protein [Chitinophagaceae bacterium]